jgi:glutamyl-tRNA reductase
MLTLFGVSFRTAPVAVRKTLTFDPAQAAELLGRAAAELPGIEAVVLATCNQTEFYLSGTHRAPADVVGAWHGLLKRLRPEAPATPADCHFYERHGRDAFRHLARLAGGLESAILGDTQLLSQLRGAVTLAQEQGTLGPELSDATAAALRLGRAARSQTGIASGSAGIGSAVAATIPDAKEVAVVGAGEAARSVARHLAKRGDVDVTFCNRTPARADRLSAEFGGTTRPWEELARVLQVVDAVAVVTSAPAPVLDEVALGRIARRRRMAGRAPLVVVDAGFPPQVTAAPVIGACVIPLDAIRQGEVEALALRRRAVPQVEAMVDQAVADWTRRRAERRLSGVIRRIHEGADEVTRELADDLVARGLAPDEAERILRRPLRRLLHEVVSELRTTEAGAA